MRCSHSASDPAATPGVSTPRSRSAHTATVAAVVTLLLSAATLAADPPDSESARVVADTAASGAAAVQTAQETEGQAASSARETDREPGSDAKERKRGTKEHKANLTSETEALAALPGAGPGMVEQKCTPQRLTGTHIWRIVCISPAQQQANDRAAEQQAKDYLRRLSEQGTIAPAVPNRYITAGPF